MYPQCNIVVAKGFTVFDTNVLIVDDDPLNRLLFRKMLENLPCQITTAENGPAALAALKEHVSQLVLLNMFMPIMNGLDVLKAIRADTQLSNLKVVLVTALPEIVEPEDRARADAVLSKPVLKQTLTDAVAALLRNDQD